MAKLIKHQQVVEDTWVVLGASEQLPPSGDVIIPSARWREEKTTFAQRGGRLGLALQSDDLAEDFAEDLKHFQVITVDFPKFGDGRGYTQARLLRERFHYTGELRAVGYVLRDQLFYMQRCGFDAYELKSGKDVQGALEAFHEFSVTYQPAADEQRPLFRRM